MRPRNRTFAIARMHGGAVRTGLTFFKISSTQHRKKSLLVRVLVLVRFGIRRRVVFVASVKCMFVPRRHPMTFDAAGMPEEITFSPRIEVELACMRATRSVSA